MSLVKLSCMLSFLSYALVLDHMESVIPMIFQTEMNICSFLILDWTWWPRAKILQVFVGDVDNITYAMQIY